MRLKYTSFVLLSVIFFADNVAAQHYEHTTLWAKTTLTAPLSKKWDVQFEYVHRSQNNPRVNMWNPLNHEGFEEPRLWFFFKQPNYTIQLNPITYFYSEALLGSEADFNIPANHIWQSVIGLELRKTVSKFLFKGRFQYEYRWLKSLNYVPVGRVRLRGTVQYQVAKHTKLQVYDEVFLSAPPHKLTNHFDQNWFGFGFHQHISDRINVEISLMRNYRQRANGYEFDHETALNGGVNFRIF